MRFRQLEENIKAAFAEALPRLQSTDAARIRAEEEKTRAALVAAGQEGGAQPVVKSAEHGRNDFVTIKKGDATQTLKYKKAEPLLSEGWELVS